MAESIFDIFLGADWERYAGICGNLSPVICMSVGLMSLFFGFSSLVGLWTVVVGFGLAIFEFPAFACLPHFESARIAVGETALCKNSLIKAASYGVLSLFCYLDGSICIAAGLMLDVTALFIIFQTINRRSDYVDIATANGIPISDAHEFGV